MPNDCCEAFTKAANERFEALSRLLSILELGVCGGIGELDPTPLPPPSCSPHCDLQGGDPSGVSRSATSAAGVPFSAAAAFTTCSVYGHFHEL